MVAKVNGRDNVVRILIDAGARTDIKNKDGQTWDQIEEKRPLFPVEKSEGPKPG